MYIVNNICYASQPTEDIKVTNAQAVSGGILLVTFSTGEKRLFDTTLLKGPVFQPLKDESIVSHPVISHGVITWMNGEIDIAPETVYRDSYPYEGKAVS